MHQTMWNIPKRQKQKRHFLVSLQCLVNLCAILLSKISSFIFGHPRWRTLQFSLQQQFVLTLLNFSPLLPICNFPSLSLYSSHCYYKVGISSPSSISRKINRSRTYIDLCFSRWSYFSVDFPREKSPLPESRSECTRTTICIWVTLIWVLKYFKETGVSKICTFCRMTSGVAPIAEIWITGLLL